MVAVLVQRDHVVFVRGRLDHLLDVDGVAQLLNVLAIGGNVQNGGQRFGELDRELGALLPVGGRGREDLFVLLFYT